MITNKECEIIFLEGRLEGFNYRLKSLENLNDRYDLKREIESVKSDINNVELKLKELCQ